MDDIVERLLDSDDLGARIDAIDEIERLRAKTEWRDIETAPKDGVWILVFVPTKKDPQNHRVKQLIGKRVLPVRWVDNPGYGRGHRLKDRAIDMVERYGGFWSSDKLGRRALHGLPSHWMPMPDAPEE